MVQHFQYFPFYPRAALLVTARKLLFVHYLGCEHGTVPAFKLHQVHAPDVAAPQPVHESEIAESEIFASANDADYVAGFSPHALDRLPPRIG